MLGEAVRYPMEGESWVKTVLIGGIFVFLGVLVVPAIFVEGYVKRVLARTVRNEETPPVFDEWVELFADGIKMYLIQIAYVIVPGVLLVIGLFLMAAAGVTAARATLVIGIGVTAVGGLLGLLVIYLLPAAMCHFARRDALSAGFAVGEITSIALTTEYLVAWLVALVLGLVLGVIGSALSAVIVGVFVLFYVQVVVARLWATGYRRGRGHTSEV